MIKLIRRRTPLDRENKAPTCRTCLQLAVAFEDFPSHPIPRTGTPMQLWNDYEGKTIDESYPLEKLISPEGRSAFFSTRNGTGALALVRLIESHFDEAEI